MITFAVIVVVVIILVAIFMYGANLEQSQYNDNVNDFYTNRYTEDIDFSLMVKGYPVVNDYDIGYTQWLADSARTSS